ncbi:SDR family NAD(P)-dependent oxidoreductase [Pseudoroseicyclus tamaricis]|uniref:SDR family oxidoreductase n=1 Tax=Pseudoroseicyclus tamaricis TaxID=2705421 RepID=A0A6B2K0A1_9RHOB|nr:SDR family oxidoreductase [Pseudoroseicyclus tamaricis]NDV01874.1 SDR family oxidoreductase [Pseudoroseicyclus tamaricis]
MQAKYPDLSGAPVFITGGGSGIGALLVEGFLRQNARVAFCDIVDSTEFADRMGEETGARPLFLDADVTDTGALKAAMRNAEEAHGPLAVLVNNAANDQRAEADEVDEAFWDWSLSLNLKQQFFAAQEAAAQMRKRGGGRIVNYSSIAHALGGANMTSYVAAKAGVAGMTRSLARAWGKEGIRVNAIAPGLVVTERQRELWITEEGLKSHVGGQAIPRPIAPEDLVGPTLFLASEASAMIAAQVIVVDGGYVIHA